MKIENFWDKVALFMETHKTAQKSGAFIHFARDKSPRSLRSLNSVPINDGKSNDSSVRSPAGIS